MPLFFLDLVPGSGTYLSQEPLSPSESCKRWLRKTALAGLQGWPLKRVQPVADASCVPPSPAGPHNSCPLHLLYLFNLKFVIGNPNRCCILELRGNHFFVCNFLSVPRCQGQIAPKTTHCPSCLT